MTPVVTGRAEEQTVDDVQPGRIADRRALWGRSRRIGTRHRWNECRGWREPGYKDDLADPPRGGQEGGHCGAQPKLQHPQEQPLLAEWEGLMRLTS
jgi:hypothetical protein